MKTSLTHAFHSLHYSDLGLTQRVHNCFARYRAELWWATGAGGGGILRHGRARFHPWGTRLFPLRRLTENDKEVCALEVCVNANRAHVLTGGGSLLREGEALLEEDVREVGLA